MLMQRFGMDADVATAGALLSLLPILVASIFGAYLALLMKRENPELVNLEKTAP